MGHHRQSNPTPPKSTKLQPNRPVGFTLLELMIVIAIIGVLAAIAYPGYLSQVQKSKRIDAINLLDKYAIRQEVYYTRKGGYTNTNSDLGFGDSDKISQEGYYTITEIKTEDCGGGTCFLLKAKPVAGSPQMKDTQCREFTLNSTSNRTAQTASGEDSTAVCWNSK